jgi:hypothetical protein
MVACVNELGIKADVDDVLEVCRGSLCVAWLMWLVVEVGFGCAYSADRIQYFKPRRASAPSPAVDRSIYCRRSRFFHAYLVFARSHTIIECSPVVLPRLRAWAADKPSVRIVEGTWQVLLLTASQ